MTKNNMEVTYLPIGQIKTDTYNPRKWSVEQLNNLKESITRFGIVDPLIVNYASGRKNILIGGHMRLCAFKDLKYTEVPVVLLNISEVEKEKELNLRLNQNQGEWDLDLLSEFDESILSSIGFSSEDLDSIFEVEDNPMEFDLQKELNKLGIDEIKIEKGDLWKLGEHTLMCGDSTIEKDMLHLMGDTKADLCFTDPPYILDYLNGKKKHGKATEGFGLKRDRKYLETDVLPDNFSDLWMSGISKIAKKDFHIICYENWKNIRTIWTAMEKHWKIRNMIVWHLPNRVQNFAGKYKFFNKHDIAMVGSGGSAGINQEDESELLTNHYETALYATTGAPHWESYKKGKKYCPTDFIEFKASDEKSSGQGVIFGTKPVEILIPYIKVLTKRDDVIVEPFGGSGSTLIASERMNRKCFIMEKSPIYAEVIRMRWEKETGGTAVLVSKDKAYGKQEKNS